MGQKVTFYNEINIEKPVGDIRVPGNSANLSANGIYFTPANNILQNQPPHIVQGQYIYTLGSKTINEIEENSKSIVSSQIQNNEINFTTNNDSYFVSDVKSDEFNKTITVTKSAIDLSNVTTPLKNIFNSLKSTECSIRVNDTTIRLYWDDEKGLKLSDSTLHANNILIINDYKQNNTLRTDTQNIVRIFAYTELTVSIPNAYNNYLTVADLTTNLEPGYKYGKVIKLKTQGTGWLDDFNKNSYTFSGFSINAKEDTTYTSANDNYSFALSKNASPFEFNKSNNKYNVSESSFNLLDVTSGYKADKPNYTQKSLYNVHENYCSVSDTNKTISITNAYYISDDAYATITVTDNTKSTDIYYKTSKDFKLYFSGAKQWGLVFDCNGGPASYNVTKKAYYNKAFTFPANPTREGYTFAGWYTAKTGGTKVTSVNAGESKYTWHETNYDITLYAHWTQTVKYYWYVGQTEPTSSNYTTLASQVTSYPSTYNYTVEKRGYVYVLIANNKSITRIYDTSNGFDQAYNEITSSINGYKLYKTASAAAGTPLAMVII